MRPCSKLACLAPLATLTVLVMLGHAPAQACSFTQNPSVSSVSSTSVTINYQTNSSCLGMGFNFPEGATCCDPTSVGSCSGDDLLTGASAFEMPSSSATSKVRAAQGSITYKGDSNVDYFVTFVDLTPDTTYYYWIVIDGVDNNAGGVYTTASADAHGLSTGQGATEAVTSPNPLYNVQPFLQNVLGSEATLVMQTADTAQALFGIALRQGSTCSDDESLTEEELRPRSRSLHARSKGEELSPANVSRISFDRLSPDSKYWYYVGYYGTNDLVGSQNDYNFITPPSSGDQVGFYVFGDTRTNNGATGILAQQMLHDLSGRQSTSPTYPRFILNTGDFAGSGCDQDAWIEQFFNQAQPLLKNIPMYTAPGNHEYHNYYNHSLGSCKQASFYYDYFDYSNFDEISYIDGTPSSGDNKGELKQMYSFDLLGNRFVSLDFIWDTDDGNLSSTSFHNWLVDALSDDTEDINNIFLFYHAPMVTQTVRSGSGHPSSFVQIETLSPLLQGSGGGKVAAVFNGHNHFYERSKSLLNICPTSDPTCANSTAGVASCAQGADGTVPDGAPDMVCTIDSSQSQGITYILSGGGGAGAYDVPPQSSYANWLAKASNSHHYVRVEVDGSDVGGTTYNSSGTVIDGPFTIREP